MYPHPPTLTNPASFQRHPNQMLHAADTSSRHMNPTPDPQPNLNPNQTPKLYLGSCPTHLFATLVDHETVVAVQATLEGIVGEGDIEVAHQQRHVGKLRASGGGACPQISGQGMGKG